MKFTKKIILYLHLGSLCQPEKFDLFDRNPDFLPISDIDVVDLK